MSIFNTGANTRTVSYDQGMRNFMLGIYNYMALGLLVTAAISFLIGTNQALLQMIFRSGLGYVVMFLPLGLSLYMSFRFQAMSFRKVQVMYWIYCVAFGVALSYIFAIYRLGDIFRAFFVSASLFGAMSIYGYTTKRDLSGFGGFLIMGLFGLMIAGIISMFMGFNTLLMNVLAVLICTGLVAYETQNMKSLYYRLGIVDSETARKFGVFGAMSLYTNFINIFVNLLRIMGGGSSRE